MDKRHYTRRELMHAKAPIKSIQNKYKFTYPTVVTVATDQ